ncbi:type I-C CRISPR-associated protein Cas7/Csd2 [Actinoalloteichus hymeniacidonis]|uniref:CRISPR-associated protein, Csd2 family n=1 Tax=Actinoalloteichus hymeniacidonis TaxID=340345 RepID=A0AAC9HRZ8_9PSEU|nr:type I-C CRISPR-associated protein Cas7/Csd2 [Actinoalloteichus hymeniacidonis]AOS63410.1 CRISPR-associated protein, Csd2 family [Actinoalloteichus hymeniacidonis]MBB5908549.1 CRISPR-associated protein Csd2 [Actinoalloteichus hymeniacidonis]
MTTAYSDPAVRHDMLLVFDVLDGNPNGDPDAANQPRQDLQTNQGLITDAAIKRKIRDTVPLLAAAASADPDRYRIFVEAGETLNPRLEESYTANNIPLEKAEGTGAKKTRKRIEVGQADEARAWLRNRYYDLRLFGGVLGTGNTQSLGKMRGPMQVTFGRSVDPIAPEQHAITRVAKTRAEDAGHGEMGNKWTVPYGLYTARIHYSAVRGKEAGVTADDLELFYRALLMMWDHTSSASRGEMATRGLYVFSHPDAYGVVPAHKLLDRIVVHRTRPDEPARSFAEHYKLDLDDSGLPAGVTVAQLA